MDDQMIESSANRFLKWWPFILFLIAQTMGAGILYGDLRSQLTSMQTDQKVLAKRQEEFITRREYDLLTEIERLKRAP